MSDAFFTLYSDLDREGPGEPGDVTWAADVVNLPAEARICDAGCGSGGDIPSLLSLAPHGKITAVDLHKPFIDELLVRVDADSRVMAYAGNMTKLKGPFDFIWSAGAVYFQGIGKCLTAWRPALAKDGAVAFSHPCHFTDAPSDAAVAFWTDECDVTDAAGIAVQVQNSGYETVSVRRVSNEAWDAYYRSLETRFSILRHDADEALRSVLDASQAEIDLWAKVKEETGYLISVVRPV